MIAKGISNKQRWKDIEPETRALLHKIACTPSTENSEPLSNQFYAQHLPNYSKQTKRKLEWEFEGAVTAHTTGEPRRYTR